MSTHKLAPASAYSGPNAVDERWEDFKRIRDGRAPLYRSVTETGAVVAVLSDAPLVLPAPMHLMEIDYPEDYKLVRDSYLSQFFAGHDARRGGGHSPFNRGVGG